MRLVDELEEQFHTAPSQDKARINAELNEAYEALINTCNASGCHPKVLATPGKYPGSPLERQPVENGLRSGEKELRHALGEETNVQAEVTCTPPYPVGTLVDYVAQHDHARHTTEPLSEGPFQVEFIDARGLYKLRYDETLLP